MKPNLEFYHSKKTIIGGLGLFVFLIAFGLSCIFFPEELVSDGDFFFRNDQVTRCIGYGIVGIFSVLLIPIIKLFFSAKAHLAVYKDHLLIGKIKIERDEIRGFELATFTNTHYVLVELNNPAVWIRRNAKNSLHMLKLNNAMGLSGSPILIPVSGLKRTPEEVVTLLNEWNNGSILKATDSPALKGPSESHDYKFRVSSVWKFVLYYILIVGIIMGSTIAIYEFNDLPMSATPEKGFEPLHGLYIGILLASLYLPYFAVKYLSSPMHWASVNSDGFVWGKGKKVGRRVKKSVSWSEIDYIKYNEDVWRWRYRHSFIRYRESQKSMLFAHDASFNGKDHYDEFFIACMKQAEAYMQQTENRIFLVGE